MKIVDPAHDVTRDRVLRFETDNPALAVLQKTFEQRVQKAQDALSSLEGRLKTSKRIAYVLKFVAVFGGVAIGTGLPGALAQGIGIAISLAVAFDTWLSNQKRAVALATAVFAYRELIGSIWDTYELDLVDILSIMEKDPAAFEVGFDKMHRSLIEKLSVKQTAIESALARLAIDELRALAVEPAAGGATGSPTS